MMRGTADSIKGLVDEPVLIIIEIRVYNWGTDHCDFILWEGCIT